MKLNKKLYSLVNSATHDLSCKTVLHTGTCALNTQTDRQTDRQTNGRTENRRTDRHTYMNKDIDGSNALQAKKQVGFKPTNSVK